MNSNKPGRQAPRATARGAMTALLAGAAGGAFVLTLSGWRHAVDLFGEPLRYWVAFLSAGGLAGGAIALHARLWLEPHLGSRLARSFAVGVGFGVLALGGLFVAYLMLFGAGSAPVWPVVFVIVIGVAAAAAAHIVLTHLCLLAVRLLSRAPPPQGAPGLRGTVVLLGGAVFVLAAIFLSPDGQYRSIWYMKEAPRRAAWYEDESALFTRVLAGHRCAVLVVPVEAGRRSLDVQGRLLLSQFLAMTIADRTGLCVSGVDLVHRALGSNLRRYDEAAVRALAATSGATWIVRGEAIQRSTGDALIVRWSSHRARADGDWDPVATASTGPLPLSDAMPPEALAVTDLQAVAMALGLPATDPGGGPAGAFAQRTLPRDVREIVADTGSDIDRAERLQLLAAMMPPEAPGAGRLWIRSLLPLRHRPEGDPQVATLRARAWFGLGRRPYAERLLAGNPLLEAAALRPLVLGNLPEAIRDIEEVPYPVTQVIDRIGVERLRGHYDRVAGHRARFAALAERHPSYAPWLVQPFHAYEWHGLGVSAAVADALEAEGVAVDPWWLRQLLAHVSDETLARALRWWLRPDVAGDVETAIRARWLARASAWSGAIADRPAESDLLEVLAAANRAGVVRELYVRAALQARKESAVHEGTRISAVLRRHPMVQGTITWAARWYGGDDRSWLDANVTEVARDSAEALVVAEGGETAVAEWVASAHEVPMPFADEPPRPRRAARSGAGAGSDVGEKALAGLVRAADLTQFAYAYVRRAFDLLEASGRAAEARAWLDRSAHRFHGSPESVRQQVWMISRLGDPRRELPRYEALVRADPTSFTARWHTAIALLALHEPQAARRVLATWPDFADADAGGTRLASYAHDAAALFHLAGEVAAARTFAEQCMAFDTGAASELRSDVIVAALRREWDRAEAADLEEFSRYGDVGALERAAWFACLAGDCARADAHLGRAQALGPTLRAPRVQAYNWRILGLDAATTREGVSRWRLPPAHAAQEPDARFLLAVAALLVDREADDAAVVLAGSAAREVSAAWTRWIDAYVAFRRGRASAGSTAAMTRFLDGRADGDAGELRSDLLPYVFFVGAHGETVRRAAARLDGWTQRRGVDPSVLQARAVLAHRAGHVERAVADLWQSYISAPAEWSQPLPPGYAVLELAEALYREGGDERYRRFIVDVATRATHAWPWGWAYGFLSRHATDPIVRANARREGQKLDVRSLRMQGADAGAGPRARGARNPR